MPARDDDLPVGHECLAGAELPGRRRHLEEGIGGRVPDVRLSQPAPGEDPGVVQQCDVDGNDRPGLGLGPLTDLKRSAGRLRHLDRHGRACGAGGICMARRQQVEYAGLRGRGIETGGVDRACGIALLDRPEEGGVGGPGHLRRELLRAACDHLRGLRPHGDVDERRPHRHRRGHGARGIGMARRDDVEGSGRRGSSVESACIDESPGGKLLDRPEHGRVIGAGHLCGKLQRSAGEQARRRWSHHDLDQGKRRRRARLLLVGDRGDAPAAGREDHGPDGPRREERFTRRLVGRSRWQRQLPLIARVLDRPGDGGRDRIGIQGPEAVRADVEQRDLGWVDLNARVGGPMIDR